MRKLEYFDRLMSADMMRLEYSIYFNTIKRC